MAAPALDVSLLPCVALAPVSLAVSPLSLAVLVTVVLLLVELDRVLLLNPVAFAELVGPAEISVPVAVALGKS